MDIHPVKIAFITDLHIDNPGVILSGRDTRRQLLEVIQHISERSFDCIILGGDLCNATGDTDIYHWIKDLFEEHNLTVNPIPGNHDSSILLSKVFGLYENLRDGNLFYQVGIRNINMCMLDSSLGVFNDPQWNWLEEYILKSERYVYIFMHHPPVISGSKHMEPKYMFREMSRFQQLCQQYPEKTFFITTGHYHMEKTIVQNNLHIYISPSTYLQINPEKEDFQIMPAYYGYRNITISENGTFQTNAVYL